MEDGVFSAVTKQFSRSMGHNSLIPVQSVDESQDVDLLTVVVKRTKRQFLYWHNASFDPYKIQLEELLVNDDNKLGNLDIHESHFVNYNRESSFSLSGKIGVQIMKEMMDVNLTASDTVTIKANLGDIIKQEINKVKILQCLRDRKVDIKHNFLNELREDESLSLCTVCAKFSLADNADISRKIEKGIEAGAKVKVSESATVDASGKLETGKQKQFGLYKGTVVAYKVAELNIDVTTGSIEPVLFRGGFGGFFTKISLKQNPRRALDTVDGALRRREPIDYIKGMLNPVTELSPSLRGSFRSRVLKLMSCFSDMEMMVAILEYENGNLPPLGDKFTCEQDVWHSLLEMAGVFDQQDKTQDRTKKDSFKTALLHILDSLLEMTERQVDLLQLCKEETAEALLALCKRVLNGQPLVELDEPMALIKTDQIGKDIVHEMNLTLLETNTTVVTCPLEPTPVFEHFCWVLYAFYGSDSENI